MTFFFFRPFFFQRWDVGALATSSKIDVESGTAITTNPVDYMFEHAFMFNRDLSKWKIGPGILWAQNFFGMIKLSGSPPVYSTVRNAMGDPR